MRAVPNTAVTYSPPPTAMPTEATTNSVAADVMPVTRLFRLCRMEPAPMKPMPGMICAAMRVWSPRNLTARASESSVYIAAPTQIKRFVRRPAGRCLDSRSSPMSASQQRRQHQAQQEYSRRGHLALQDVVDVLDDRHEGAGGWILSPENFPFDGFPGGKLTQMITGKNECGRSSPWAGPMCESRRGE